MMIIFYMILNLMSSILYDLFSIFLKKRKNYILFKTFFLYS
nr:MAG TPA: hypothetical protein [Caudoviricetes sp.]